MASRSAVAKAARVKKQAVRRRKDGSRAIRYSDALAAEVLARIARGGVWSRIGGTDGMPDYSTLFRWRDTKPDFAEALAQAQAAGNEIRADEVLAVSMDATRETIQEARLQVGSLKWHVSRADGKAEKETRWTSGKRRLTIRIREFERAWGPDGTPYVREVTMTEDRAEPARGRGPKGAAE